MEGEWKTVNYKHKKEHFTSTFTNPDKRIWDLYLGALLTKPDHFHCQCGCESCDYVDDNEEEYNNLIKVPLSERNDDEIIFSNIKTIKVTVTASYPNQCKSCSMIYKPDIRKTKSFNTNGNLTVQKLKEIKDAFPYAFWGGGNCVELDLKLSQKELILLIHTVPVDYDPNNPNFQCACSSKREFTGLRFKREII